CIAGSPTSIAGHRWCRTNRVRALPDRRTVDHCRKCRSGTRRRRLAGVPVAVGQMVRNWRRQEAGHPAERIITEEWLQLQRKQIAHTLLQSADQRVFELRLVGKFRCRLIRHEMASAGTADQTTDMAKAEI